MTGHNRVSWNPSTKAEEVMRGNWSKKRELKKKKKKIREGNNDGRQRTRDEKALGRR